MSSQAPNVVITNPKARKVARTVLDVVGAALVIFMAIDAATEAFNLIPITTPVLAGWTAARSVFGFAVDNPNTPTQQNPSELGSGAYVPEHAAEEF